MVKVELSPKPNTGNDETVIVKDNIADENFVKKPQKSTNFDENDIDIAEALLANKEHKDQLNIDVKIGDGMDIAIHGENGKYYRVGCNRTTTMYGQQLLLLVRTVDSKKSATAQ